MARDNVAPIWSCAALAVAAVSVFAGEAWAVDKTVTGQGYHYQVTDHYCASASLEMVLDCTAVRTTNPFVNTLLNAPATFTTRASGAASSFGVPQPTYSGGAQSQVTSNPQVAIYNLIHGAATFTPVNGPFTGVALNYNNPFSPFPTAGSDNTGIAAGLNILDNPNVGGLGNHNYNALNFASNLFVPNLAAADYASRTMANAIQNYDVAAQATVGHGAHAVAVVGFTSVGTPARNQPYTLTGMYVNDPWTGYVREEKKQGRVVPGGEGIGIHAWLKYGYKLNPNGPLVQVPGFGLVRAVPNAWFKEFTPAPGQPGAGANMQFAGYKEVVEPLGPELPDDGNGGILESFPDPDPLLANFITTPADARAAAVSQLATFDANDEYGLSGGGLDSDLGHIMQLPGGDWMVPYDRGGMDTGAVLIDMYSGTIDQATWIDATQVADYGDISYEDYFQMFSDFDAGIFPDNNAIPEPGAVCGAGPVMLLLRRRRR